MFKSEDYVKYMEERFIKNQEDYLNRVYLKMRRRFVIAGYCHEFTGAKNKAGYGLICFGSGYNKRTSMGAHRFIYWQHTKQNITDKVVMHTCDNPSCINPEHLKLGTYQDNAKDMWSKGRANYRPSKGRRIRKLTDEQVRRIRVMQGDLKMVARIYDISISYVSKLKNSKAKQLVT